MHVKRTPARLAVLVALVLGTGACGPDELEVEPETWMIDTFTSADRDHDPVPGQAISNLVVSADGTARYELLHSCGAGSYYVQGVWKAEGPDSIRLWHPDGEEFMDADFVVMTKHAECDRVHITKTTVGLSTLETTMHRGRMCLSPSNSCDPSAGNCDSCFTTWCTDPPPACEAE